MPETITAPSPTIRVRIEHSRTIKDGWGYSSTVEMTSETPDMDEMRALLAEVRQAGENERDIRNAREAALREDRP